MNLGGEQLDLSEPLAVELENSGVIRSFVCQDPDGYLLEFVRLLTRQENRLP